MHDHLSSKMTTPICSSEADLAAAGMEQSLCACCAGDFWHVRGSLPVQPLNAVLQEFKSWKQPTLMLVGNHDQVTRMAEATCY